MNRHVRTTLLLAVSLGLAAALPARAADGTRADLFAGYSYHDAEEGGLHGWRATLAWDQWGKLGLVADVSGHYGSAEGVDFDDLTFMGGLRFALHGKTVTPFVYGLAGGALAGASVSVFDVEISESQTSFAWAAGGGFDVRLSDRWAVRAQADYLRVESDPAEGNLRVGGGVVYRIGR
jgi:opacity protein-like surface antigen